MVRSELREDMIANDGPDIQSHEVFIRRERVLSSRVSPGLQPFVQEFIHGQRHRADPSIWIFLAISITLELILTRPPLRVFLGAGDRSIEIKPLAFGISLKEDSDQMLVRASANYLCHRVPFSRAAEWERPEHL
ncbi:MAG: hypothetical protein JWM21_929 [Acidobacteria bacterium]|nr:hypothetical protein [Acidobacteriota bacterium]